MVPATRRLRLIKHAAWSQVACYCLVLLAVVAFPAIGNAQFEGYDDLRQVDDGEFDPFAPNSSPEVTRVAKQLDEVNCELLLSQSQHSVVGIRFFSKSRDKRLVTTKDWESVGSLPHLKVLYLPDGIAPKDLESLGDCPQLKILHLPDGVSDQWLPAIAKFKRLQALVLGKSEVTPEGLAAISKLPLKTACFAGCTQLNDRAMETIADWEDLQNLNLADVPLSDDAVHILRGLTKLEWLDVSCQREEGNAITNRSVPILKTFKGLTELRLTGTQIDESGEAELQEALPACKIFR